MKWQSVVHTLWPTKAEGVTNMETELEHKIKLTIFSRCIIN